MTARTDQEVSVLICCSDNRLDILERVLPSIHKFWPDCPYLQSMLELRGSIWDFEHHRRDHVAHYVVEGDGPIPYSHLVDNGRWLLHARSLLRRTGSPSDLGIRPVWSGWVALRLALDKVQMHIFGLPIN